MSQQNTTDSTRSSRVPSPAVSVVLGSYNRYHFLKRTIQSVRKELEQIDHEIIVVDGGSTDKSLKWLVQQKDVLTIIQHNRGKWLGESLPRRSWGYFMNLGFKCAKGVYTCMISDDCLIVPGAIQRGYKLFEELRRENQKVGALAFYWRDWPSLEPNYHVGITLGNHVFVNHGMYLTDALREVSYADEKNYNFYCADGDLCLKLWEQGYQCLDAPNSYIEHYRHANVPIRASNTKFVNEDYQTYLKRWGSNSAPVANLSEPRKALVKRYVDPAHTVRRFGIRSYLTKTMAQMILTRYLYRHSSLLHIARKIKHKIVRPSL